RVVARDTRTVRESLGRCSPRMIGCTAETVMVICPALGAWPALVLDGLLAEEVPFAEGCGPVVGPGVGVAVLPVVPLALLLAAVPPPPPPPPEGVTGFEAADAGP